MNSHLQQNSYNHLSSLPYQYHSNSLDKNGLNQQQLFVWESSEVRDPEGSRKGFQSASSITETIHRISWHIEGGSPEDYLTKITRQGELTDFKSKFGGLLKMHRVTNSLIIKYDIRVGYRFKVYNKNRLLRPFTKSPGSPPYEIANTTWVKQLRPC